MARTRIQFLRIEDGITHPPYADRNGILIRGFRKKYESSMYGQTLPELAKKSSRADLNTYIASPTNRTGGLLVFTEFVARRTGSPRAMSFRTSKSTPPDTGGYTRPDKQKIDSSILDKVTEKTCVCLRVRQARDSTTRVRSQLTVEPLCLDHARVPRYLRLRARAAS